MRRGDQESPSDDQDLTHAVLLPVWTRYGAGSLRLHAVDPDFLHLPVSSGTEFVLQRGDRTLCRCDQYGISPDVWHVAQCHGGIWDHGCGHSLPVSFGSIGRLSHPKACVAGGCILWLGDAVEDLFPNFRIGTVDVRCDLAGPEPDTRPRCIRGGGAGGGRAVLPDRRPGSDTVCHVFGPNESVQRALEFRSCSFSEDSSAVLVEYCELGHFALPVWGIGGAPCRIHYAL